MFHMTDARGKTVKGHDDVDQVQHFWTLCTMAIVSDLIACGLQKRI